MARNPEMEIEDVIATRPKRDLSVWEKTSLILEDHHCKSTHRKKAIKPVISVN